MKIAKYVNWYKHNECLVIANLLTENMVKICGEKANIIEKALNQNQFDVLNKELFNALYSNNIIINDDIDENEIYDHKY